MKKFKQKSYAIPAILSGLGTAFTVGSTAIGIKQASDQAKQQEELAARQERDNAKTRKALENLANSDASPEVKQQASNLFSERRLYAVPGGMIKNLGGLAKDVWVNNGSNMKNVMKMGAGIAASGYVGNRLVRSLKDHDEGNDKKTGNFLKKAVITTGTVGTGILAAKKGMLGKSAQSFMTKGIGGKALSTAKEVVKDNISPIARNAKTGKLGFNGSGALGLALGAGMPIVSYLAQKKAQNNMAQESENAGQQQYSVGKELLEKTAEKVIRNPKKTITEINSLTSNNSQQKQFGVGEAIINAGKLAIHNPKRFVTGGISKATGFLSMTGKGGTTAVQNGFQNLSKIGQKSGNVYTQKLANWGIKNPNMANLAVAGTALGAGKIAMDVGTKAVETPMKAIDKDAYKDQEQQNETI